MDRPLMYRWNRETNEAEPLTGFETLGEYYSTVWPAGYTQAEWFEREKRVAKDTLKVRNRNYGISTVFLQIDHGFSFEEDEPAEYKPVLWETMVFTNEDDPWSDYQERYTSYADAVAGHKRIIAAIQAGEDPAF